MQNVPDTQEFLRLKDIIVAKFTSENWQELGMLTDCYELVDQHHRLLRSLSFNDPDYGGHAMSVLRDVLAHRPANFHIVKDYVDQRFPGNAIIVSSAPGKRRITFAPSVFEVPDAPVENDLVALMMPFDAKFNGVHKAIRDACEKSSFNCKRADDVWDHAVLVQDVFKLIYTAHVVISDFSGKNPNVMYETGIAHTLGKTVIPITQNSEDVPFDLKHHRYIHYLPNKEGLADLTAKIAQRLRALREGS